jgi:hypothetical protein
VVAVVALCALSGCDDGGSTETPSPTVSAAPTQSPTTVAPATEAAGTTPPAVGTMPPAAGAAAEFVAVVRRELADVAAGRTDAELASVATTACQGLADGTSADDVTAAAQSLGTLDAEATDQATARELVKLAIDTACPAQATRVDEF